MGYIKNSFLWNYLSEFAKSNSRYLSAIKDDESLTIVQNQSKKTNGIITRKKELEFFISNEKLFVNNYLKINAQAVQIDENKILVKITSAIQTKAPKLNRDGEGVDGYLTFYYKQSFKEELLSININDNLKLTGKIISVLPKLIQIENEEFYEKELHHQGYDSDRYKFMSISAENSPQLELLSIEKTNCFIASVVYENKNAPEVLILRKYRDEVLEKMLIGRMFVQFYNLLSPYIANRLHSKKTVNIIKKYFLDILVIRIRKRIFPSTTK